mgnify:CR=1 FL=1
MDRRDFLSSGAALGVEEIERALPEPVAELCRRETAVAQLCVDAAAEGSREKALQCLLLDPVITDIQTARNILDDFLTEYKTYLPQFWS